jgi:hypothetical protein
MSSATSLWFRSTSSGSTADSLLGVIFGWSGCHAFHEYDGAGHRDRHQQRSDLRRDRDIEAAGWVRRGYTDLEVLRRPVMILRDADRTLRREHDPQRLDAWYSLLADSCFTASGRQRLLRRLGSAADEAA